MKTSIKFFLIISLFFQTIKFQGQTYYKLLEPEKIWNFYNATVAQEQVILFYMPLDWIR